MTAVRVLSFGSVPPEWGGPSRGGVATFHATLVEALRPPSGTPAEIVGIVSPGDIGAPTPVPRRALARGESRRDFLRATLAEMRPDVAILQHFATAWGTLLPDEAPGLPLVGVAHSWHMVTQLVDRAEREAALTRVQQAMDGLSVLVVGSEHARREGLALGFRYPAVTEVIRYPVQPAFAEPIDLSGPRDGVAFLGGLIERKNPSVVLDAVATLPGVTLTIAGEGPEEEALRRRARSHGIEARVRFEPHRAPGEHVPGVRDLLARSELLCVPSVSESFGLVYVEALACGTPVVGFGPTVDEIRRAVGVDVGVALERPAAEPVAEAIEHVRGRSWERAAMREAALRTYSVEPIARRYAEVLATAAAKLRSAAPPPRPR